MIKLENIYWMLAYAFRCINDEESKKMQSESFENIYDLFCVMLTQGITKQIKRGLHKEYIEKTEAISGVKGKILISDSVRNNSLIDKKLVCEFDEYSENSYLNKIIKTAACYIIKSKKVRDINKQNNLKKVLQYLDDVDTLNVRNIQWDKIKYNRNNVSYKFLVNVSKFVLESLLAKTKDGEFEFLNDIDDQKLYHLYEKFILEYFKYHYKELKASSPRIEWSRENDSMIEFLPTMQTDIVLEYNNKTLIIDAKYYSKILQKKYDKETYRNNNIYQIITYVKNADPQNTGDVSGMLLYAKTDKESIGWKEDKILNNVFVFTELDLSKDFSFVQEQMENIANWLKSR